MIDPKEVLNKIPDKWESKTTTTKKFKLDLYEFVVKNNVRSILEIGSSVGHSAFFLGHYVDKFSCVELDNNRIKMIQKLCSGLNSVVCHRMNVYAQEWRFDYHDMVIIDCIHDYKHASKDINNSLNIKPKYLAFDDYGLFPGVKKAVDEFISNKKLEVEMRIGYATGSVFSMSKSADATKDKKLLDSEGIICKVI